MTPTTNPAPTPEIDALRRDIKTLETRVASAENRLAATENTLAAQTRTLAPLLVRIAGTLDKQLAATNQLGQLFAAAELLQATRSTPATPWKPIQ